MSADERRPGGEQESRDLTFEDLLRWEAMARAVERSLERQGAAEGEGIRAPATSSGASCGGESNPNDTPVAGSCGCRSNGTSTTEDAGGGHSGHGTSADRHGAQRPAPGTALLEKPMGRRHAVGTMVGTLLAGTQVMAGCTNLVPTSAENRERLMLAFRERLKANFRVMTDEEKRESIRRIERLAQLDRGLHINLSGEDAQEGVVYGYAFNVSKCKGYRECVAGCIRENNQDRRSGIQYIRIFEMEGGEVDFEDATAEYQHEVPREGHFYMGTQCFQCTNPPCVEVCPVAATWQEPDGIVVIDYDWCIGCRYCIAACPYWARRFNWAEPEIPPDQVNPNQHYLGNRIRRKGCVEKCMFCIQRTRKGRMPACQEACPTGARIFGNLLDPDSEIRWVIENKQVFRLKEDLGTEPRFWYFMD